LDSCAEDKERLTNNDKPSRGNAGILLLMMVLLAELSCRQKRDGIVVRIENKLSILRAKCNALLVSSGSVVWRIVDAAGKSR